MKRVNFLLIFILFGIKSFGQVEIVDGLTTNIMTSRFIGNNCNYCVYAKFNSTKSPSKITYITYNYDKKEIKEVTVNTPKNNQTGRLINKIRLVNDNIYELHLSKYKPKVGRTIMIVKRKLNKLINDEKIVNVGTLDVTTLPKGMLYFNENGKYVVCNNHHTANNDFILVLNDDLSVRKRIDISVFYPPKLRWGKITNFQLQKDGDLVMSVLLNDISNKEVGIEDSEGESNFGFLIIKPNGEKIAVRTELKKNMKYSYNKYRYNESDNTIESFFRTVNDDKEGVQYYVWDAKSGKIKKSFSYQYLISDFTTPDVVNFYKQIKSKDLNKILANKNNKIHKLKNSSSIFFLDNNEFVIVYHDFYLNDGVTSTTNTFHNSLLIFKFNEQGEKEWVTFHPNHMEERNSVLIDKTNNKLFIISSGREINYQNDGRYTKTFSKKGKINSLDLGVINLNTGEYIVRKKIGAIDNSSFTPYWCSEKNQINLMLTKVVNTSSKKREHKFTTIDIDGFMND